MRLAEFPKLILAYFLSQIGSHFLTLSLASFVLFNTGSLVQSSLVFVFSYLPSVFVSGQMGAWLDRHASRRLFVANELVSSFVSILCGYCFMVHAPIPVLCLALAVRSVLGFCSRTLAMKWIKLISRPEEQGPRFKLFLFSFFMATAVSGTLAASVLALGSISAVIIIDVASYWLGAAILSGLVDFPIAASPASRAPQGFIATLREIAASPRLLHLFLLTLFTQAIFQGAYTVLVTALPMIQLGMGLKGVGSFQLMASAGIISGFYLLWARPNFVTPRLGLLVGLLALTGLLGSIAFHQALTSLVAFYLLNFGYEVLWLYASAEYLRQSPSDSTARYQFVLSSAGAFLMSIFALLYSYLMGQVGIRYAVCVTALIGLVMWAVVVALTPAAPVAEVESAK